MEYFPRTVRLVRNTQCDISYHTLHSLETQRICHVDEERFKVSHEKQELDC